MNIELVTIGTELLLGFTVDTNGAELGRALAAAGIRVVRRTSIPDEPDAIRAAVRDALARTGAVVTTGGLGPTRDDVSKKVVAELFGAPLEFDESIWQALVERFAKLKRRIAESNRSQAEVPRGALVLPNRWGTAPGLWLEGPPGLVILLPGVPLEMRKLLEHEVVPRLHGRAGGKVVRSSTVRTTNIAESTLADRMGDIEREVAPLTLAYLPSLAGVDLRLTAWNLAPDDAERRLAAAESVVRERAGEYVYGGGEDDLAALVLDEARHRGLRIATAESCTGGLIGVRLTAIPGSSEVFLGGIIAYDNQVKTAQLGVPMETLATHGAVSEEAAAAMARGAAARFGAGFAIAVTGVAGPGGGTAAKPVGTVCFGFALGDDTLTHTQLVPGIREEVRARSAQVALFHAWRLLQGGTGIG